LKVTGWARSKGGPAVPVPVPSTFHRLSNEHGLVLGSSTLAPTSPLAGLQTTSKTPTSQAQQL